MIILDDRQQIDVQTYDFGFGLKCLFIFHFKLGLVKLEYKVLKPVQIKIFNYSLLIYTI